MRTATKDDFKVGAVLYNEFNTKIVLVVEHEPGLFFADLRDGERTFASNIAVFVDSYRRYKVKQ